MKFNTDPYGIYYGILHFLWLVLLRYCRFREPAFLSKEVLINGTWLELIGKGRKIDLFFVQMPTAGTTLVTWKRR